MGIDESDYPLTGVGGMTAVDGGMLGTLRGRGTQPAGLGLHTPNYFDPIASEVLLLYSAE